MGLYDKCPCRGCESPVRYPGCHGKCEEYASWKQQTDVALEAIRKENKRIDESLGFLTASKRRVDKRLRIRK